MYSLINGYYTQQKDDQATIHKPEKLGKKKELRDLCGCPCEGEIDKISRVNWEHLGAGWMNWKKRTLGNGNEIVELGE